MDCLSKTPTTFLFAVPILSEPWTREFLLHQIWSCITISGTFTLYLLWLCLHSSLLLSPALWQTLILCFTTANCFSFCISPVLMGLWMMLGSGERNKMRSGISSKLLKTIAFLHSICLQQSWIPAETCNDFVAAVGNNVIYWSSFIYLLTNKTQKLMTLPSSV